MNELQKKEFDMLQVFIDVCNKLNLNYFLVCGSALGAVKYKGFIPWDDDIDVALVREEYELFLEKAPKLLPKKYFLQNIHTEKAFPLLMTKLRNSETTLIEDSYSHLPINHGIYIDIFPLDGYPEKKIEAKWFEMCKWVYNKARCFAYIFNYDFFQLNTIMLKYEKMLKKNKCKNSKYICNYANWQGKLEYSQPEHYGDGAWAEFEGTKVRIPERYDEYLTLKYGDWKKELPIEKQKSHHLVRVCDLEKSYKEYLQ